VSNSSNSIKNKIYFCQLTIIKIYSIENLNVVIIVCCE